jgi:hypothetical protein
VITLGEVMILEAEVDVEWSEWEVVDPEVEDVAV